MKTTMWVPLSATLLFASACGGSEAATGAGPGGTGGATAGAGGATGSATSSGSGSGGEGGAVVTVALESFSVPPGGEVYKCQNFKNPFGGDAEVTLFESHMTKGSHHMLLFYKKGIVEDGPLEDCSGLEFHPTPYSTQLPDDELGFPSGVAALVGQKYGLRIQSHYLNTTSEPIDAHVELKLHLARPGEVTAHAGVLFVVEPNFAVAPNSTSVVKHDCQIPFDMKLIKASSHMHKHGTKFTSTIAGATVFDTDTWDDPKPAIFEPARSVKGSDPLHFECTFVNDSADTLTFGESAQNNEMCIFVSAFYPIPNDNLTTVDCQ